MPCDLYVMWNTNNKNTHSWPFFVISSKELMVNVVHSAPQLLPYLPPQLHLRSQVGSLHFSQAEGPASTSLHLK